MGKYFFKLCVILFKVPFSTNRIFIVLSEFLFKYFSLSLSNMPGCLLEDHYNVRLLEDYLYIYTHKTIDFHGYCHLE